jgi:DNA-directed RNA polymerase subunit RPC12/RpoP
MPEMRSLELMPALYSWRGSMNDEPGSLNCPSCGWNTMLFVGELDLDDEVACKLCGASTLVKDLRTSTGEALIDHLMRTAADKFHGDVTYRPRRT